MIDLAGLPSPTDPAEYHADFLELATLRSANRVIGISEFVRDLNLANVDETLADASLDSEEQPSDDRAESIAESAFSELDDRAASCGGGPSQYPFEITDNALQLRPDTDASLYTFLALLSWLGKDGGRAGVNGEKLFEEVCAQAAAAYLGGPLPQVQSYVFGFPRRIEPRGFKAALDHLCKLLGEGEGHHKGRPKLPHERDGKLDIVAWREFQDRRQGKLIAFGQCATGKNWGEKVAELPQTTDWCTYWMADRPGVFPVRAFFVPHRVDRTNWFDTCIKGGLLLDRCRIVSLLPKLDDTLQSQIAGWSSHALTRIRETAA